MQNVGSQCFLFQGAFLVTLVSPAHDQCVGTAQAELNPLGSSKSSFLAVVSLLFEVPGWWQRTSMVVGAVCTLCYWSHSTPESHPCRLQSWRQMSWLCSPEAFTLLCSLREFGQNASHQLGDVFSYLPRQVWTLSWVKFNSSEEIFLLLKAGGILPFI